MKYGVCLAPLAVRGHRVVDESRGKRRVPLYHPCPRLDDPSAHPARHSNPDDQVMHLDVLVRSLCGRDLPTAGFFTDNDAEFETREGSRCKACWHVYVSRHPRAVPA